MKERAFERAITKTKFGNVCLDCANWETVKFDDLKEGDVVRFVEKGIRYTHRLLEKENDTFQSELISTEAV